MTNPQITQMNAESGRQKFSRKEQVISPRAARGWHGVYHAQRVARREYGEEKAQIRFNNLGSYK